MQSDVQKNWNDFYGNNRKPSRGKMAMRFIIFMIIMLSSALVYGLTQNNKTSDNNTDTNKTNYTKTENITKSNLQLKRNTLSNIKGKEMAKSINIIDDIIHNLENKTQEQLKEYIKTISKLNLSSHYDIFKDKIIEKIEYYIIATTTFDNQYLEKYNEIDYINELAKAFDNANVRYKIIEDSTPKEIKYWYNE